MTANPGLGGSVASGDLCASAPSAPCPRCPAAPIGLRSTDPGATFCSLKVCEVLRGPKAGPGPPVSNHRPQAPVVRCLCPVWLARVGLPLTFFLGPWSWAFADLCPRSPAVSLSLSELLWRLPASQFKGRYPRASESLILVGERCGRISYPPPQFTR